MRKVQKCLTLRPNVALNAEPWLGFFVLSSSMISFCLCSSSKAENVNQLCNCWDKTPHVAAVSEQISAAKNILDNSAMPSLKSSNLIFLVICQCCESHGSFTYFSLTLSLQNKSFHRAVCFKMSFESWKFHVDWPFSCCVRSYRACHQLYNALVLSL